MNGNGIFKSRTFRLFLSFALVMAMFMTVMPQDSVWAATAKKHKVTFKVNAGEFTADKYAEKKSYSVKKKNGAKIGKLPKATREGYKLKGWYTKKSGGKKITKSYKVKKKITLYAQWKKTSAVATTKVKGLNVIEMYTKVKDNSDTLISDYIPSPRELDDYHDIGLYKRAGVPYDLTELRLTDSEAKTKYPDAVGKYEALTIATAEKVEAGLKKRQAVLFTGAEGDTDIGVAAGVRRAYPNAKIGVVYLDSDAEGDGMAAIMGVDADQADIWSQASNGGKAFDGLLLSDGRAMDEDAKAYLSKVKASADYYKMINTATFKKANKWETAVNNLAAKVDVIYLHVDADVLHQAYIPHTEAGAGEGAIVWDMLENLETVMQTGKVAAINMASMYTEETKIENNTARGFTVAKYPSQYETVTENVNRFCLPSILNDVRMISASLKEWTRMPAVPKATTVVPQAEKINTDLKGLKVVEINTRNETGGIFVGRNKVASGEYSEDQRGTLIEANDNLYAAENAKVGYPREVDDWNLAGLYNQAGVPVRTEEIILTQEEADKKYPNLYRYEALCKEIADSVYDGVANDDAVVVVGSGCMPVPAVAGGLRRAAGNDTKIGMIYIDAHGDINTMDSTLSGGIGGMDVAPTMGIDPHPLMTRWWDVCSDGMEPVDELLHAGGRNLDGGLEKNKGFVDDSDPDNVYQYGEMLNLQAATSDDKFILSVEDFENPELWAERLADFASRVDTIYLHIDQDALDGAFLPNGGSPEGYQRDPIYRGPTVWTTMDRIQSIMETDKVSVVYLASVYGDQAYSVERLARHGFVYPAVEGENGADGAPDEEIVKNRANAGATMSGMRLLNSMICNWTKNPEFKQ